MNKIKRYSVGRLFNTLGILFLVVGIFLTILSHPVMASDLGPAGGFSGNIIGIPTSETGGGDTDETPSPVDDPVLTSPAREQQSSPISTTDISSPTEVFSETANPMGGMATTFTPITPAATPSLQPTFRPRVTLLAPPIIHAAPPLNLSPICGYVEDTTQLWLVFNPNSFAVNFTWVTNLGESGEQTVGANSFAHFITSSAANTVSLYVGEELSTSSATVPPCKTYLRLSYVCTANGINWYVANNNNLITNQLFTWVLDGTISGSGTINAFETVLVTTSSFGSHTLILSWNYQPEGIRTVSLSTTIESCGSGGTPTVTFTPSNTPSPTATPSFTPTFTPTFTATPTDTPTFTPTFTATPTDTPTFTPTFTATPTDTPTFTPTFTATPTDTPTFTPTFTATPTDTPTFTPTFTATPTDTPTFTPTFTATPTDTSTFTPTPSSTAPPPPPSDPTRTPTRTIPPPPDNRPSLTPSTTPDGGLIIPVTGSSLLGPNGSVTSLLIGLGLIFLFVGVFLSKPLNRHSQSK